MSDILYKKYDIKLPCFGIIVSLTGDGGGDISSDLKEHTAEEATDAWLDEIEYNCMIDGIESMILGHAVAGIDIETPAYIEGIETAVQGCANQ